MQEGFGVSNTNYIPISTLFAMLCICNLETEIFKLGTFWAQALSLLSPAPHLYPLLLSSVNKGSKPQKFISRQALLILVCLCMGLICVENFSKGYLGSNKLDYQTMGNGKFTIL